MAYPSDLVRTKNWGSEVLTDTDLEGQFDLIINWVMASLNSTSGHVHDATSNNAPKISAASGLKIASQATGDLLYASSSSVFARLGIGSTGQALLVSGGLPSWGTAFTPSVSNALSGSVIQTIRAQLTTPVSVTGVFTADDTPPLYSEGTAIANSGSVTPNNSSNIIHIRASFWCSFSATQSFIYYLTDGTGSTASFAVRQDSGAENTGGQVSCFIEDYVTAGSTSARTYYLVGGVSGGTVYIGTLGGSDRFGAATFGSIIVEEIKA